MNLQTFLLISKDSGLRQLVQGAAPQTKIYSAENVSEGLSLWPEIYPALVLGEGNPHSLSPLLEYARQTPESSPLLVIGERHSIKDAVEIMRAGAADYLTKPVLLEDIQTAIARALRHPSSASPSSPQDPFASIISLSPQMNLMKQLADRKSTRLN